MDKDKVVLFGQEARLKMKQGMDKGADAVKPTLGAVGMEAAIEFPGLDPLDCDDGVTILKNLQWEDPYENMGLRKLKKAALRTSAEGGDGTATTTVLTQALTEEAFKEIGHDSSKIREVRERLEKGLSETLSDLASVRTDIPHEDMEKIALISSLDSDVARVVADIIKQVGITGQVEMQKGRELGYTTEIVKGIRFEKGLLSPFFIPEGAESCELDKAHIMLVDRKLSVNEQILPMLKEMKGQSVLIIADMVEGLALATAVLNAQNKVVNVACVQNPFTGSRARDFLFDVAAITGAKVISEEAGMKLTEFKTEWLGKAEKVIANKSTTRIIGGKGSPELADRVKALEEEITGMTSEYQRAVLEERLAQLTGGVGVVRYGAFTDTDFNAKKYKFDNAVRSTQAALQEGVVPGGGVALFIAAFRANDPMFKRALKAPIMQMAKNAGVEDINSLLRPEDEVGMGINFITKEKVKMVEAGIIDPFKVIRLALESAVSIATSLVSKEVVIADKKKDETKK